MTIFAQQLNICSPKFGGMTAPFTLPGYTPGNSDW